MHRFDDTLAPGGYDILLGHHVGVSPNLLDEALAAASVRTLVLAGPSTTEEVKAALFRGGQ